MIVLQRESPVIAGVKDTVCIVDLNFDMARSRVSGMAVNTIMTAEGYVKDSDITFLIMNENVGIKVLDPAWDSASTPAKPNGFILEDPSTWGSLLWEDIPFIDDPSRFHFDKMITESKSSPFSGVNAIEYAILKTLQANKKLPTDGWEIVNNGIARKSK